MKTLKIFGLVALIMISSSCERPPIHVEPEFISYNLYLSFQDISGNDLVKGIEFNDSSGSVKDSLYTLDIIVSEPCWNWDNDIYNAPARPGFEPDVNRPTFGLSRFNGYSYLTNQFGLPVNDCPEQKILTYKLKCPYLFGDDAVHELVTYWDISKDKRNPSAKCYRIDFEDNEITPAPMDNYEYNYTAAIILE
ncbi:hypothetical protein [Salinimicrobium marinum]|nr:hypothetical protein [Salinimicrobium marinum]